MSDETGQPGESRNFISLRLSGEALPPGDEITQLLGIEPEFTSRKGEISRYLHKNGIWQTRRPATNVWIYNLARWEGDGPTEVLLQDAVPLLERLAPALVTLDRPGIKRELYMSTIRVSAMGGHTFPQDLIRVAAAAHLSLALSIMVLLDDDDDDAEPDAE